MQQSQMLISTTSKAVVSLQPQQKGEVEDEGDDGGSRGGEGGSGGGQVGGSSFLMVFGGSDARSFGA